MENENFDFEQKSASGNKDLWLFLIIIDIICLCVFGFFLYKNLSARFFVPAGSQTEAALEEQAEFPSEDVLALEEESVTVSQAPAKTNELPKEVPAVKEPANAQAAPAEKPLAQAEPAAPEAKDPQAKESVIVKPNPKSSKYRRVTFRYYGTGKKVSIVSGFTMAKPQALLKKKDYWETTLSIAPGRYRFLYIVDGVNVPDPYSPEEDGRSLLVVE